MALRALQGPTGGGTPVGGTGTTNTIPRWNPGPSTLGDSGLIDNGTAIYTTTRNFGIGTASPVARLDVSFGAVGLVVGADNAATTRTDNTSKFFRMASYPYTNANRPNGMFTVDNTLTENVLGLGGGSSLVNAATRISFFTGATTNTQTGTEAVRITSTAIDASLVSGYGLKLPATPGNADTQTLDCYQENYASNSWTPVIFGGTTAGTATYSVQEGFYTRWGNLIFCTATVVFSGHTGTGNLSLSGLPFAAKTAGSGTYRSSIIIEEGGGVKAILRLQSGTTATTTGVSIAASGNYVITFVYATN
jgi:hypothetical protein